MIRSVLLSGLAGRRSWMRGDTTRPTAAQVGKEKANAWLAVDTASGCQSAGVSHARSACPAAGGRHRRGSRATASTSRSTAASEAMAGKPDGRYEGRSVSR